MADYKLNQLSIVEEVNPNDLLHVRVEKRANMVGDEDRRISYRDFLSGLRLNRFLPLEGGTMVGPLGILKLTYRGKLILDPTNATEFYIGDTAKTFKIDAKGFDVRVADGSSNAKIYHERNKPTPQDVGVRTNAENDQRYAKLGNSNIFMLTQTINADGTMLVLKNTKAGSRNYIEARNSANAQLWFLGLAKDGTTDVYVNNTVSGANIVLKDVVEVNKTLKVTGQIQPSEFANFDARYFTQTAASQRFAQLVGDNNFKGVNTFAGGFNIVGDNSALVLKNTTAATGLYLLGQKSDGTNKFYLGTDNSDSVVNLHNYTANTTISLSDVITATKTVKITGQVQPSDWTNIDARYIAAGTAGNLAKINVANTFKGAQTIVSDNGFLVAKNATKGAQLFIRGQDVDGADRWHLGNDLEGSDNLVLKNVKSGSTISLLDSAVTINKNLQITGQVQPSNWANIDARYIPAATLSNLAKMNVSNTFSKGQVIVSDGNVISLKNQTADNAQYIEGVNQDGSARWWVGIGSNGADAVSLYNNKYKASLTIANEVSVNKSLSITGQVKPSDFSNLDARYLAAGASGNLAKTDAANIFKGAQSVVADNEALTIKNVTKGAPLYIRGQDSDSTVRWYLGNDKASTDNLVLKNVKNDVAIGLLSNLVTINKTTQITGQVQPSDFANFDARYYGKSATDAKYFWSAVRGTVTEEDGGVAWNQPSGIYLETTKGGGSNRLISHMFANTGASTPAAQLMFEYQNGGMWYRTARDAQGFESEWSKIYTEAQKPTPAEIGSYTKQEVDAKLQSVGQSTADYKNVYPIGMVVFFNSNVNPNSTFTGTKWAYLTGAAGRTIRIANATGDNVTKTGGSDSVTLTLDHLPQHTHTFSGSSSAFDYGTKGTNAVGDHAHSVNLNTNAAGNHSHRDGRRFNGNVFKDTYQYGATSSGVTNWSVQGAVGRIPSDLANTSTDGNHSHNVSGNTTGAGNHSHSVAIGAHTHTFSGTTGANGKGQAFSVTNPHYFLMAWVRTA